MNEPKADRPQVCPYCQTMVKVPSGCFPVVCGKCETPMVPADEAADPDIIAARLSLKNPL